MKRPKQWDNDAEWGSDILGNGACQGNLTGKVKTKQIGFVRTNVKTPKAAKKTAKR